MISAVLVLIGALVQGAPPETEAPAPAIDANTEAEESVALARYNELSDQTKNNTDAQWKLAQWCEQHGLKAEAYIHYAAVVRLDPSRLAAWRKLGFKKHNGRIVTDDQLKDEAEQRKADQAWGPLLSKLHRQSHDPTRRNEALAEFAKIIDPRAVPAVYRELCSRGPGDQLFAVQILGQINEALSTRALAMLSVYGASSEARRQATETLKGRDPNDYLPFLISLLAEQIRYEVRPVGGPGMPGVLFVEGERFNLRRFYAPPSLPFISIQPGDVVGVDAFGLPLITRTGFGSVSSSGGSIIVGNALGAGLSVPGALASALGPTGVAALTQGSPSASAGVDFVRVPATQISVGQNLVNAQKGAVAAQIELQYDVALIERINRARRAFDNLVLNVVKDASGEDLGDSPKEWRNWLARRRGKSYPKDPEETARKPTLDQLVPIAYNPTYALLTQGRVCARPDN